ncbi:MAG: AMP-binding protein [Actinobacteria bacterium]|nr:AMP-binding protein [Actinomycetota bacterium]
MAALPLRAVDVAPGPTGIEAARSALIARLEGDGAPFALIPEPSRHVTPEYAAMVRACVRPDEPVQDDDTALVAATSGSTGSPRGVLVTRANLHAAVEASWEHIPGLRACSWVLALPVTSIGGFGAIVRATLADTALHALPSVGGAAPFRVEDLLGLRVDEPFAISIVPTQLADILESPDATAWLSRATTVLVGAAATPESLAVRARDADISLVTTYGMTETTGGCVYDGVPLPGVRVELVDDGRVDILGPQVAAGYRGDVASPAFSGTGDERRFRTADHGTWRDGRLTIAGRIDDVVAVHGVNVSLGAVESVVRSELGVRDAAVVGVPDARQGHRIVAFVVMADLAGLAAIAPLVVERLGGAARPEVTPVDALPLLPSGKIDRLALRARAQDA